MTRSGWAAVAVSAGLVAAGRILGIFELFLVGAAGLTLAVTAFVLVKRTTLHLDVARSIHPPRVHAGTPSKVELRVRNRSATRTPLLELRDPVGPGHSARVILAPLGQDQSVRASYRLPTERRGILTVGPLSVEVSDPFGLARVMTEGAPEAELTVWPAIETVSALPHTHGDDPHSGADHPNALSPIGEDFYGLRAYTTGDDLRKVHWRSTARRDELVVRQDEMPWQGRATVLLDTRRGAYSPEGFERAVSAAASVVVACWHRRFLLRLVTTAGHESGTGAGSAHVDAILEHLATVRLVEAGRLTAVLASLRRPGNGGALAALVGGRSPGDLQSFGRLRSSFGHLTVVAFAEGRWAAGLPPDAMVVDDEHGFGRQWDRAMRRRSHRSAAAARAR